MIIRKAVDMSNALDGISSEKICEVAFEMLCSALCYHYNRGRTSGDWLQHAETPKHQILFQGQCIYVEVRDLDYGFTFDETRGLYVRTTVALQIIASDVKNNWNFGVKFVTFPFLDSELHEDEAGDLSVEIENINTGSLQWISTDPDSRSALENLLSD